MDIQEFIKWFGCWLWLKVIHLDSIESCLATVLIIFLVLLVLPIERFHTMMDSSKFANWRKLGTRIWLNSFCHHGSIFLMSPWCSGSTSDILDFCVSAVIRIPLAMIGIPFVAISPPFYVEHRLWRARTRQLNSVRKNSKIWEILLDSCYEFVNIFNW